MADQRNIVVVGASASGLMAIHDIMKNLLPALKAKADGKYHVYLMNPSSSWYFRVASPRAATSAKRLAHEKILFDIESGFKQYSSDDFTFIEASATSLDTSARTISYKNEKALKDETLPYHAIVIATGSRTFYPAFSQSAATQATVDAIQRTIEKVEKAKDVVVVGGGPTAVEFAAELAEHRNGKPGWFSNSERKLNITLITATESLLAPLRPVTGKAAERKLNALGVDVIYNTRVVDTKEDEKTGRTTITLAKGDTLEADLYVPAYGVVPNSSWLPRDLLDEKDYLKTSNTLRVDAAGPRVYSVGDVSNVTRNNVMDILGGAPVLAVNMKRDLLSYNATSPDTKPKGIDRVFTKDPRASMIVPVGSGGGVGEVMNWRVPSFLVWLIKGRDFLVGMSGLPTLEGKNVKATTWTKEEAAIV
jgi:NADH dehydrogenase FAD-containing subunit